MFYFWASAAVEAWRRFLSHDDKSSFLFQNIGKFIGRTVKAANRAALSCTGASKEPHVACKPQVCHPCFRPWAGWLALHVLFLQHIISVSHQLLLRRTPLPHFMPVSNNYPKTTKLLKAWSVHSLSWHLTKVVLPVHLYKVHKKLEARTSLPVLQVINRDSHSSRGCGFPCMCT